MQRTADSLAKVSVVRIASAAAVPSSPSSSAACRMPRRMLSMGRYWPMTPVEATSTSPSSMRSAAAVSLTIVQASSRPRSPVQALALPLLTTSARIIAAGGHLLATDDHRRRHDAVGREHGGGHRGRRR